MHWCWREAAWQVSLGDRRAAQTQDGAPQLARHLDAASTRYIGASAGSTVAAQFACGTALEELFDAQIAGAVREITVDLDLHAFGAMMADAAAGAGSPQEVRRRIGTIARTAQTPSPEARRAVIESRPAVRYRGSAPPSRSKTASTWTVHIV
jgi:NTE family protein